MIAILLAGVLAGAVHVITGPDHLAVVAPLAAKNQQRGWHTGFLWGSGHVVGVTLIAVAAWLLRAALPLENIAMWSEQIVGVVLIALGAWTLRTAIRDRLHVHEHEHDGVRHVHLHLHHRRHHHESREAHGHRHTALGLGALHGVAGTSHLIAVIPALAFPAGGDAAAYLLGYGMGSIVLMAGFGLAVGSVASRLRRAGAKFYTGLSAATGAIAIVVGVVWLTAIN